MIFGFSWLDIILAIVLLSFLVSGWRQGFFVTLGRIVGLIAGAVAAFYAVPVVSGWVHNAGWRLFWVVAVAVVLVILGQGIGTALGSRIRLWLNYPALKSFDRLMGAFVNTAVAAIVVSALSFSVAAMGIPVLSRALADSKVISTIREYTPEPVDEALANARSAVMGGTIPELIDPFAPTESDPAPEPEQLPGGPGIDAAADSVVKVSGTAFECGMNQTGSGFAAAEDRVITNAHVVAGVTDPVVTTRDGRALPATIAHFDPAADLAVLEVPGLGLSPIPVGQDLEKGRAGVFMGHPAGGPFRALGATVQSVKDVPVQNIYGGEPSTLNIYQLGADIEQGNSGGPLVDEEGRLIGVVFAKARGADEVGYALTLEEVAPLVDAATSYDDVVSSGACKAA
ncbi:MarP family serine protease [Zhihengliuella halotolerans]|uniref:Colicin V production protein n=1 Tax=Zhihengliuella halotolerans TaxID=370736 RepID=A0A4Q8ADU7_9MICC|nr:MarP family serine protease [Zhihengliuella halotolerans]RZU62378.1 colicin V production protein [Zhihengliuella halotolerans]